ncbi:hypothetical protein BN12_2900003 [Nostocoides japonicum T1-X7]|uniref:Uncharacterized protein n=1 Tax=Nostocoides japonicum T1-X7 TaxID=1194083 RepID=A0A077LZZ9_9MICO|nr:hypothetical protein BN12_2900003 [Tetrasphaera japonica T1-X7]
MPSARCAEMTIRWALSRRGSIPTAASDARSAPTGRPASRSLRARDSSVWRRTCRSDSRGASSQGSDHCGRRSPWRSRTACALAGGAPWFTASESRCTSARSMSTPVASPTCRPSPSSSPGTSRLTRHRARRRSAPASRSLRSGQDPRARAGRGHGRSSTTRRATTCSHAMGRVTTRPAARTRNWYMTSTRSSGPMDPEWISLTGRLPGSVGPAPDRDPGPGAEACEPFAPTSGRPPFDSPPPAWRECRADGKTAACGNTRTPRVPGRAHLPLLHSCPGGVQ